MRLALHDARGLPEVVEDLQVREVANLVQDARDQLLPLARLESAHRFRVASHHQRAGRHPTRTGKRR